MNGHDLLVRASVGVTFPRTMAPPTRDFFLVMDVLRGVRLSIYTRRRVKVQEMSVNM